MPPKRFTILVIPEGSHKVRRFSVERVVLKRFFAVAAFLSIGFFLLVFDYVQINLDQKELHRLRVENRSQGEDLHKLMVKLDDLRKELVVLAQNDAKVRVMAKLTKPKNDSLAGIGGPAEADVSKQFDDIQRRIDTIRRQIDLRRESQEEIQGFLNDERSLLSAKPTGWPVKGWLTSTFGMRRDPFTGKRKMHEGLDIAARTGTDVRVTADGIVSSVRTEPGYGKMVVVEHGYGYRTYYSHNSKNYVKVGQRVKRGDRIAAVGNTGRSTGSHVHYEIRLNGLPVNPKKYL
ncbi:MAG: peptidoglycan DD-metalloendopeptidase family protein [Deltaproteobacteria bacterium]|nr:peptidoglycan DD-metalloendopeptidase family protein [Deltaproteobacteria bacterium]MBW2477123.1 peptidoglycan DD-metalloendopeptidase family protein [Deltaproteobacteria bacterium]MBW2505324.1 peptidoglycan DD-metalloendopeptidase family protein [Deltaproteobacteria bacterium]MBW2519999.1 peptidoglycan DD-metalloendopeptidase family protein [Deltaproteobacteria bacterium]